MFKTCYYCKLLEFQLRGCKQLLPETETTEDTTSTSDLWRDKQLISPAAAPRRHERLASVSGQAGTLHPRRVTIWIRTRECGLLGSAMRIGLLNSHHSAYDKYFTLCGGFWSDSLPGQTRSVVGSSLMALTLYSLLFGHDISFSDCVLTNRFTSV